VFFATYTPRQKTLNIYFAVAAAKLYEVFDKLTAVGDFGKFYLQ